LFGLNRGAETQHDGGIGWFTIPGRGLSFALIPAAAATPRPRYSRGPRSSRLEIDLPADRSGFAIRCRVDASAENIARVRRDFHRASNHRSSAQVIAAMVILLAACGWIVGGADGVQRAVTSGLPRSDGRTMSREAICRSFGACPLRVTDVPGLFNVLMSICHRAGLSWMPDLYYLPVRGSMNAYALGGPDGAAIILTDGLLRGMTLDEIAGILAHEVAHIRNNDAWAMNWAAALHRTIELTSLAGLASLQAQSRTTTPDRALMMLLGIAPAIGQLLCLALSRIRELDADATALELTGDSRALVNALDKLERHHTGVSVAPVAAYQADPMHLLRSHPATAQRVGTVLSLAH
jgi:heat shock protein HtpX